MGVSTKLSAMVAEGLREDMIAVRYCLDYRKQNGGVLGFPASKLLFSAIDTIGSYYRGARDFYGHIDGRRAKISNKSQHFFVLNSSLFGCTLSSAQIEQLYRSYRSTLLHNSVMPTGNWLVIGTTDQEPFHVVGDKVIAVRLLPLHRIVDVAVDRFLRDPERIEGSDVNSKEIAPKSKAAFLHFPTVESGSATGLTSSSVIVTGTTHSGNDPDPHIPDTLCGE